MMSSSSSPEFIVSANVSNYQTRSIDKSTGMLLNDYHMM